MSDNDNVPRRGVAINAVVREVLAYLRSELPTASDQMTALTFISVGVIVEYTKLSPIPETEVTIQMAGYINTLLKELRESNEQ